VLVKLYVFVIVGRCVVIEMRRIFVVAVRIIVMVKFESNDSGSGSDGTAVYFEDENFDTNRWEEIVIGSKRRGYGGQGDGIDLKPIGNFDVSDGECIELSLDLDALWRLVWEHRRYANARGFSDSEMQVLKAVENEGRGERVLAKEVKSSGFVENYSDSAVDKALDGLIDKDLIVREDRGVYRYTGPG